MSEEEDSPSTGPLTQANEAIHERQEEALLSVIERLTALDFTGARVEFTRLTEEMVAHLAVEDETTHRRYAALTNHPRGAAPELFDADHVSHAKVISACEEALAGLTEGGPDGRREMVLVLPLFFRLRNVLEHHTLREQRFLYPRLDAELDPEELLRLTRSLNSPAGS